jgi:1-deoxy-D-xylulose-5-phosphate reductoisomerase
MADFWTVWMDLSLPSPSRRFLGSCGAAPMASVAVLWFGEKMSAVPLRNNKAAASARTVTVLGATGSIGDSTMDLLRGDRDRYQVEALTANSNVEGLAKLAREFGARFAAVADPTKLDALKDALAGTRTECGAGESSIIEAAARPADWVMAAVSGAAGLKPALAAVDRGAAVALANKECLVCAGDFFMQRAAKAGACILPADSEHNALFQALSSGNRDELVRVIITASGGPFRTWASSDIEQATLAQALKHPNWSMGQKITIDSASMMNKGLEVIEAAYLFALTPDEIDVLVHPQSIIHGMVEFSDRSVVAQLGAPDMRIPIAHCLGWPDRIVGPSARLDLAKIGQLTFEAPDFERFPGLRLAYDALRARGGLTTVFNAANEVAVGAFIAGKIRFGAIARLVEATMNDWVRAGNLAPLASADDAISVDHNARNKAASLLPQIALKAS